VHPTCSVTPASLTLWSSARSGPSAGQPIQKEVRSTGHDVGPDLAMTRDRLRGATTLTFRGGAVTLGERLRSQPGLEGLFVAPPGDHQPLIPVVGWLQQFVTLESFRIVNGSGACGESVGQFVTGLAGNSDGVDLDDGHPPIVPDDSRQHHGSAGHDHSTATHRALEPGVLSVYLISTVNVPLLASPAQLTETERRRLIAIWHSTNVVLLFVVAGSAAALFPARREGVAPAIERNLPPLQMRRLVKGPLTARQSVPRTTPCGAS
jgi:hypothetical protein